MNSIPVRFAGSRSFTLDARLDLPDSATPAGYSLFAHCFTCSKNYKSVVNVARALAERHIGVLRFDFTGPGESEGEFSETNLTSNINDLTAAADYMAANYESPAILIGHSFGGAAAFWAAGRISSVRAVVTIAAPYDPAHISDLLDLDKAFRDRETVDITIAGRSFTLKRQFLEDVSRAQPAEAIGKLNKPLLIFHSPVDGVVGIDNAARIFQAAGHPKSFISLDTADHLLSDEDDSRYAGRIIAEWAGRYLR